MQTRKTTNTLSQFVAACKNRLFSTSLPTKKDETPLQVLTGEVSYQQADTLVGKAAAKTTAPTAAKVEKPTNKSYEYFALR